MGRTFARAVSMISPYTHFTLRLSDPSQSACGPSYCTCLGVLCTLGVRVVLNLLYVKFFRSQPGDFPSWSLFRPRLSSAALSARVALIIVTIHLLERRRCISHRWLRASCQLRLAHRSISGIRGLHSSRSSVSDLAAPQPPLQMT